MAVFLGSTIGLEANGHGQIAKMVRVEYYELETKEVELRTVSGRTLGRMPGTKKISMDVYQNKPSYNLDEGRWALGMCGWSLMSDDHQEFLQKY